MLRIIPLILAWLFLTFSTNLLFATEAADIIQKVEDNLNGDSAEMTLTMTVLSKRGERTIRMESYSVGDEKSFIKILYPGKDQGITFLKIDNTMWQYVPRIEKIIKIPASMMLQSWMGSDFSNDDLVKESSLSKDYRANLQAESEHDYTLLLHPEEDAAVVWGKILMQVSKEYFLPTTVQYFDEDENLVRILRYLNVRQLDDRHYPTLWTMEPKTVEKSGHQTRIEISGAQFNKPISDDYFTKRALKRFSK